MDRFILVLTIVAALGSGFDCRNVLRIFGRDHESIRTPFPV